MKKTKVSIDDLSKREFMKLCNNIGITMEKGIYYLITSVLIYDKDKIKTIVKEMQKFENESRV